MKEILAMTQSTPPRFMQLLEYTQEACLFLLTAGPNTGLEAVSEF